MKEANDHGYPVELDEWISLGPAAHWRELSTERLNDLLDTLDMLMRVDRRMNQTNIAAPKRNPM